MFSLLKKKESEDEKFLKIEPQLIKEGKYDIVINYYKNKASYFSNYLKGVESDFLDFVKYYQEMANKDPRYIEQKEKEKYLSIKKEIDDQLYNLYNIGCINYENRLFNVYRNNIDEINILITIMKNNLLIYKIHKLTNSLLIVDLCYNFGASIKNFYNNINILNKKDVEILIDLLFIETELKYNLNKSINI